MAEIKNPKSRCGGRGQQFPKIQPVGTSLSPTYLNDRPFPRLLSTLSENAQLEITCRHVWKHISDYLDGEVSAELRMRLERHFANCHHCSAILDGTRNTVVLMADERALDLPRELGTRLYGRLSEYLKRPH